MITKKINNLLFLFIFFIFIIFSSLVLAAGGGSGGSSGGSSSQGSSSGGSICKTDIWTCTEWTVCDRYNNTQSRICELTKDCSSIADEKPQEFASCQYVSEILNKLKCTESSQMRDRIACRLALTEDEQKQELQLQYLPEECRPLANIDDKEECIRTYAKLQRCWKYPLNDARIDCVKEEIGIKSIATAKKNCAEKQSSYKGLCLKNVNKQIYWLIKFRFYDLEERAEEFLDKDVKKSIIIDFVTALEEKKLEFNESKTKEKKIIIIQEVRELWKNFVKKVREDLKNKEQK